jgi:hypothetical protein
LQQGTIIVDVLIVTILKRAKYHIIYSLIVLLSFTAGQVMVFAHQHLIKYHTHQTSQDQQTVTEKCQLCDAMHHNSMTFTEYQYFTPVVSSVHFYTPGQYDFISIALILSAGRSPPLS